LYTIYVEVFVGAEYQSELEKIPASDDHIILEFKKNCFQFYLKAAEEMIMRLPFRNNIFKEMLFLNPHIALYPNGRSSYERFPILKNTFSSFIDTFKVEEEWRSLPCHLKNELAQQLSKLPLPEI